jgi:hypothetical protein
MGGRYDLGAYFVLFLDIWIIHNVIVGEVLFLKLGLIIQIYPSQTKIWEGGTKDEIQIFEALFKGVSTRFGLRTIEKSVENLDFIFCQTFQNLRLGSIKYPKKKNKVRPQIIATPHYPRPSPPTPPHHPQSHSDDNGCRYDLGA